MMEKLTPIFKKGCWLDRKKFRPVSLTSIISKILEIFVRDGIIDLMVANGLLSKKQKWILSEKKLCHKLYRDFGLFDQ